MFRPIPYYPRHSFFSLRFFVLSVSLLILHSCFFLFLRLLLSSPRHVPSPVFSPAALPFLCKPGTSPSSHLLMSRHSSRLQQKHSGLRRGGHTPLYPGLFIASPFAALSVSMFKRNQPVSKQWPKIPVSSRLIAAYFACIREMNNWLMGFILLFRFVSFRYLYAKATFFSSPKMTLQRSLNKNALSQA